MRPSTRYVLLNAICLITAAIGVALFFVNRRTLLSLCREDGIVENLTSLFYFIASGLFVYGALTLRGRNVWYWGLALMCFMVAGEEISWGQRIFGVETPDALKESNVQGEMNLHNIEGVHGNVRRLALLVILGTCFAIPLADRFVPPIRRLLERVRMPVYPLAAVGIAALAVLLMVIPRLAGRILFTLDELGEIYLSIGFLAFAASAVGQARRWRAAASATAASEPGTAPAPSADASSSETVLVQGH